jgi:hypothetical protein
MLDCFLHLLRRKAVLTQPDSSRYVDQPVEIIYVLVGTPNYESVRTQRSNRVHHLFF